MFQRKCKVLLNLLISKLIVNSHVWKLTWDSTPKTPLRNISSWATNASIFLKWHWSLIFVRMSSDLRLSLVFLFLRLFPFPSLFFSPSSARQNKKKFNVRKSTIDSYTNIDNSHSTIYLISSKQFLKVIVFTYLLCRYRPISGRIKSSSWLFTFSLTGSLP